MPLRTWKTYDGDQLDLDLSIEEGELFDKALRMHEANRGMGEISQLYLDRSCVLYKGRTGADVVKHPLYRAIKDMAKRRGLADGLLSDRQGSSPELDSFKARN